MRRLSSIALIILLVLSPSCKFLRNKGLFGKKEKTLEMLRAQQDSIRVADSIKQVQDQLLALENARLDSVRLADEARLANEITNKYNIIVGSFITPEYAKRLAEKYRQQGYDAKISKMEGSNFELVSAEAHENLNKAIVRLHQFQDTVEIDAWLYIKE
jgi:hypothetical protein